MPIYEYRCTNCGHELDALQVVEFGEIQCALGVLEVVSLMHVGSPVTQTPQVKLGAYVLQQHLHDF